MLFCDDFSTTVHFYLYLSYNNDIPWLKRSNSKRIKKNKKCILFRLYFRSIFIWFISFVGLIFLVHFCLCLFYSNHIPWLKRPNSERIKNKKEIFFRLYFRSIFTFKNLVYSICGCLQCQLGIEKSSQKRIFRQY